MIERLQEIFISLVLLILLFFLWNPGHIGMGSSMEMMVVVGLLLAFALFAIFVWREKARDEREELNFSFAGRFAFLAGSAVVVLGIFVQSFKHTLDLWLIAVLAAMILGKLVGLLYSHYHK